MTKEQQEMLSRFIVVATATQAILGEALINDDELLAEFAARGISKREIEEAHEALRKLSDALYIKPQPV